MGSRRRGAIVLAVVVAAIALTGCAARPAAMPGPWRAPEPAPPVDPVTAYAEARLAGMTLEQKVASMLMVHVGGTDASAIRGVIDAHGLAGTIFFADNVPGSASGLARISGALSSDPDLPVLIAIDQEGGIVRRIPGDTAASASTLRASPPDAARAAFDQRGALVASAGVSINFGIVADVTADRGSFIFPRVLGADAASAAPRVAAAVEGENPHVLSTLKHFPGHGAVAGDSHVSIPSTRMSLDDWRRTQAPPFEAGIAAGADLVMLGHLRYEAVDPLPASLSAEWVRVLREDLGFGGIIVTDDLTMLQHSGVPDYADPARNALRAVAAGDTLLLFVGPVDIPRVVRTIASAVRDGDVPESTIDAAVLQLLETRRGLSGRTGPYVRCGETCRAFTD